jgi:RNA polymerase sigma factor (sigma-70 family)
VATWTTDSSFGEVYRANVGAVSGFFARRCSDPQVVADLTSETFVRAIASYRHFDPGRGTARAWLIGIARNVFRRHVSSVAEHREVIQRLGSQVVLGEDDVEELAARIDAQSAARALLARTAGFPELERVALELVDVMQMSPKEAAGIVGVSAGVLRVRLFRARARLRKEGIDGV